MVWTIASVVAARDVLGKLLEQLELADYLFGIEPHEQGWAVRIECRCAQGSYVSDFGLAAGILERAAENPTARRRLLGFLRERLGDCTRSARRPKPAVDDEGADATELTASDLGQVSEYSATAGGVQQAQAGSLAIGLPRSQPRSHPWSHFDAPDPSRRELYWYALEQATQDFLPPETDLAAPEEAAMHLEPDERPARGVAGPTVATIMTRDVEAVEPQANGSEVSSLFAQLSFHHVPVVEGEKLVGLISVGDMLRAGVEAGSGSWTARDIMQTSLVTVREDAMIREAAALLSEGFFHALPVVDDKCRLVGMITSTDLIRFLADALW